MHGILKIFLFKDNLFLVIGLIFLFLVLLFCIGLLIWKIKYEIHHNRIMKKQIAIEEKTNKNNILNANHQLNFKPNAPNYKLAKIRSEDSKSHKKSLS